MDTKLPFGEQVKLLRKRNGLSQEELAARCALSSSLISKVERGKYRLNPPIVRLLAQELGLSDQESILFAAAAADEQVLHSADQECSGVSEVHRDALLTQPLAERGSAANMTLPTRLALYQLRAPAGDFTGRDNEVAQLTHALCQAVDRGGVAAITGVQGMGGIGKTELAYAVAHEVRSVFPDAQIVLNLQGASATPLAPVQALLQVIRAFCPDATLPTELTALEALYRAQLHGRRVLILADDARNAAQVRVLLPPAGSALLITSRTRFTLPAMTTIDLEQLPTEVSCTLLCSISPRLTQTEAEVLARVCGNLPLALRVCAGLLAATPALSVADFLTALADTRQCLAALRDPDDPHYDVEASLTLSYAQLDSVTQAIFRQLGVITADFAIPLACAVVMVPTGSDIAAALHHLLRRNLIMYDPARQRWRLHDLVRALAWQRLAAEDAVVPPQWRYAHATVQHAQDIQQQYLAGGDRALTALAQFDAERHHIDAVWQWADAHTNTLDGDQLLLDLIAATSTIGVLRYDVRCVCIPQFEAALVAARRLSNQHVEAQILNHLGIRYVMLGDTQRAIPYFVHHLAYVRAHGDQSSEGWTLIHLGNAYTDLGDARRAIDYFQQAYTIADTIDHQHLLQVALHNLGQAQMQLDEPWHALLYFERSLEITRVLGNRRGEGIALQCLGRACAALGQIPRAIESCKAALPILCALGDRRQEGYAWSTLAQTQARQANSVQATIAFEQALALFREVGDRWGEADCQWQFGLFLVQQQAHKHAMPLLRAALAYEQEIRHAKANEHAAVLAGLENGEELPLKLCIPKYVFGDDQGVSPADDARA